MNVFESLSPEVRTALTEALDLQITAQGGSARRGELRGLDEHGALVGFAVQNAPCLPIGQRVEVTLHSRLDLPNLCLPGRAILRRDNPSARLYSFCFLAGKEQLSDFVVKVLRSVESQRNAIRVPPHAAHPIEVTLTTPELAARVLAQLVDVSVGGMGVKLTLEDDSGLSEISRVRAQLSLLEEGDALDLQCTIRHRRLSGTMVHCGLEIEPRGTARIEQQTSTIQRYVLMRQREMPR